MAPIVAHAGCRFRVAPFVISVSAHRAATTRSKETTMAHPVIHAEIRSTDPDATREFFGRLFGWTYTDGAYPGYTFADTGAEGALPTAISPLQGHDDAVLFFVGVDDVAASLDRAQELGGTIVQPPQQVPGVTFGVLADPQGHLVGVAAAT
jgi:predicted enzyme related to lactoylglutathione lyase